MVAPVMIFGLLSQRSRMLRQYCRSFFMGLATVLGLALSRSAGLPDRGGGCGKAVALRVADSRRSKIHGMRFDVRYLPGCHHIHRIRSGDRILFPMGRIAQCHRYVRVDRMLIFALVLVVRAGVRLQKGALEWDRSRVSDVPPSGVSEVTTGRQAHQLGATGSLWPMTFGLALLWPLK